MTELATRDSNEPVPFDDPTGGRLVAWAQAAAAANQLARALTTTTFVPAAFKGNVGDATAAILMGDELGLSPLASLRSIFVVHGTPAMYARTMVALAQGQGHEIWTETDTPDKVVVAGRRKDSDKIERSEWTVARARKAGYTNNKKYETNPQEMLYAKAASTVARKVAADVLAGVPYSAEDLELEQPVSTAKVQRGTAGKAQRSPLTAVPEPDLTEPDNAPAEPMTTAQRTKLMASYGDIGIDDRDARLEHITGIVGRKVESSNDLTKAEATRVIDHITKLLEPPADELFGSAE
jgi:hypothetical protein